MTARLGSLESAQKDATNPKAMQELVQRYKDAAPDSLSICNNKALNTVESAPVFKGSMQLGYYQCVDLGGVHVRDGYVWVPVQLDRRW